MSDVSVQFGSVSKRFSRGSRNRTLAELVLGWPRRLLQRRDSAGLLEHEFWALNDVSFEVRKGEMLGIVGPNGSGKSTVLKLLYRILRPERGQVRLQGRVGGLIELGAGFHPYLTGRENVFINGAILGLSQRELREKYASIVDFAGVGEFMDLQVKNFSSGMYARLAFAVAAHARPDVLLVDEVLAVGDNAFQMKCYDWLAKQRRQGLTVVLVSHNLYQVGASDQCLYLNAGKVVASGKPEDVIARYQSELAASLASRVVTAEGQRGMRIERVQILDAAGQETSTVGHDENLRVRLYYDCPQPLTSPVFEFALIHDDVRFPLHVPNHHLFCAFSAETFRDITLSGKGVVELGLEAVRLPTGIYRAKVTLFERDYASPLYVLDGAVRLEAKHASFSDGRALMDCRQAWSLPIEARVS